MSNAEILPPSNGDLEVPGEEDVGQKSSLFSHQIPEDMDESLTKKELSFFKRKWQAYLEVHKDLNGAEDLDDLKLLITELILQTRLLALIRDSAESTNGEGASLVADLHQTYSRSIARYNSLKFSLLESRPQAKRRGKISSESGNKDIASLTGTIEKAKREQRLSKQKEEENILIQALSKDEVIIPVNPVDDSNG